MSIQVNNSAGPTLTFGDPDDFMRYPIAAFPESSPRVETRGGLLRRSGILRMTRGAREAMLKPEYRNCYREVVEICADFDRTTDLWVIVFHHASLDVVEFDVNANRLEIPVYGLIYDWDGTSDYPKRVQFVRSQGYPLLETPETPPDPDPESTPRIRKPRKIQTP